MNGVEVQARFDRPLHGQAWTTKKRVRRTFTLEFSTETVRLRKTDDRRIAQVALEFDLIKASLCKWAQRADIDVYSKVQSGLPAMVSLRCKPLKMRMVQQSYRVSSTEGKYEFSPVRVQAFRTASAQDYFKSGCDQQPSPNAPETRPHDENHEGAFFDFCRGIFRAITAWPWCGVAETGGLQMSVRPP